MDKDGLETPSIYRLALSPKSMTSTLAACMQTVVVFKKFMTNFFSMSKSEELKLPEVSSRNRMSLILLTPVNSSRSLVNTCFDQILCKVVAYKRFKKMGSQLRTGINYLREVPTVRF